MKNLTYLIVASLFFLSCSDGDSQNNDDENVEMSGSEIPNDCVPYVPVQSQEGCFGRFSCSMVDDLCGSTVGECTCLCVEDDACGIESVGKARCAEKSCGYASDEIKNLLLKTQNVIFVKSGAGGIGTKESPFGSYEEAERAAHITDVILIQGDLKEQLNLKSGVHVLGGRNSLWQAGGERTIIEPVVDGMRDPDLSAGLVAQNIESLSVVHNLEIRAPDALSGTSYGVFSADSSVHFFDVNAFAGSGATGKNGRPGKDGEAGTTGSSPVDHFNSFVQNRQLPNSRTMNTNCPKNTDGGYGGGGGVRSKGAKDGNVGSPSWTGGGEGGNAAETGVALVGSGGDSLFVAPNGIDGVGRTDVGWVIWVGWVSPKGKNGEDGENGKGGGGGGGADVVDGTHYGPNGANGGSGGCAGEGGSGGDAGGGSIGLYSVNSTTRLTSSEFSASVGGVGGAGGMGGIGGAGGEGGIGSTQRCKADPDECIDDTNLYDIPSGNGGRGGNGGNGGTGGGGAGGVSYGAACGNSELTITDTVFTKGIGGEAGGPNAVIGEALDQRDCE